MILFQNGGATLSPCERYRYHLWRVVGPEPTSVAFVMLNPSTADAMTDDPTIRKCIGFAKRWGFGRVDVVNLFAWRATDPKTLPTVADPVGPENGLHLFSVMRCASMVVCAWGADKFARHRAVAFRILLTGIDAPVHALRITKDGAPWHPLYVPYDVKFTAWPASTAGTSVVKDREAGCAKADLLLADGGIQKRNDLSRS